MMIKQLDSKLVSMANSNSFNGTRGKIFNDEYLYHVDEINSWNISDTKKQQLLDKYFVLSSELLSLQAHHVSVMVAGASNYNSRKLDKGDRILEKSAFLHDWFSKMKASINEKKPNVVECLVREISWGFHGEYSVNEKWKKLASIDCETFCALYEKLNNEKPFRKNSIAYKLYADRQNIEDKSKNEIYSCLDFVAYTEGDRAYIDFKMKPKQQLIVALKSRKWWWNAHAKAWSTYLENVDISWIESITQRYEKYI